MVIDVRHHMIGCLASVIAKELLNRQRVVVGCWEIALILHKQCSRSMITVASAIASISASVTSPTQFQLSSLSTANLYRLKAVVDCLAFINNSRSNSVRFDSAEFFNLCIARASCVVIAEDCLFALLRMVKGRLSAKADVYSFGVVLLELLSGRRALDKNKIGIEQNLVDWVRPFLGDKRKLFRLMDSRLEGQYPKNGAYAVAALALQCINNDAKSRPKMSEVLATLEPLQDSKEMMKQMQRGGGKISDEAPRSPIKHVPSPRRPMPEGSPLAAHRKSSRVR